MKQSSLKHLVQKLSQEELPPDGTYEFLAGIDTLTIGKVELTRTKGPPSKRDSYEVRVFLHPAREIGELDAYDEIFKSLVESSNPVARKFASYLSTVEGWDQRDRFVELFEKYEVFRRLVHEINPQVPADATNVKMSTNDQWESGYVVFWNTKAFLSAGVFPERFFKDMPFESSQQRPSFSPNWDDLEGILNKTGSGQNWLPAVSDQ